MYTLVSSPLPSNRQQLNRQKRPNVMRHQGQTKNTNPQEWTRTFSLTNNSVTIMTTHTHNQSLWFRILNLDCSSIHRRRNRLCPLNLATVTSLLHHILLHLVVVLSVELCVDLGLFLLLSPVISSTWSHSIHKLTILKWHSNQIKETMTNVCGETSVVHGVIAVENNYNSIN